MTETTTISIEKIPPAPATAAHTRRGVSVKETAKRLGITERSVHAMIADGRLASVRILSRRIVLSDAIDALLAPPSPAE